jgi:uncharacterized membrane protein YqjE
VPANHDIHHHERSVVEVIHDIRDEAKEFVATRLEMLRNEMRENVASMKASLPLLIGAAVFAAGLFGALTFTLVAVVANLVGGDWRWVIGGAAVIVLYAIIGGILGWLGMAELKKHSIVPERTLRVLKQDQQFLKNEVRAA